MHRNFSQIYNHIVITITMSATTNTICILVDKRVVECLEYKIRIVFLLSETQTQEVNNLAINLTNPQYEVIEFYFSYATLHLLS